MFNHKTTRRSNTLKKITFSSNEQGKENHHAILSSGAITMAHSSYVHGTKKKKTKEQPDYS
jgi:hypothetical protein